MASSAVIMQVTRMGTIRAWENDIPILTLDGELANGAHKSLRDGLYEGSENANEIIPLVMEKNRYADRGNSVR